MRKKYYYLLIFFLILSFPINTLGQFDNFWLIENEYQMDQTAIEEGEEIGNVIILQNIDLYWSTNTYTPLNYQGRKLPTKGSWVSVFADLKISGENPINLKYSWFLDGIFQENKSGYGKDSLDFMARRTNGLSHNVLLKIFNNSRSFVIERSIEIPIAKSEIFLYETYRGSYFSDQINEKYYIPSNETISFIALPYFFDVKKITDLNFKWTIPGQEPINASGYNANILKLTIKKENQKTLEREIRVDVSKKLGTSQNSYKKIKIQIY